MPTISSVEVKARMQVERALTVGATPTFVWP